MARSDARTTVALCLVGTVSIALGSFAAVYGVPANYGLTTDAALAALDDRPVLWTAAWVAWSATLILTAVWRAVRMSRHKPWVRRTAVRGSLWLGGAIGASWFFPWIAWDLQLFDVFEETLPADDPSAAIRIGMWWWLASGLALVSGAVWSLLIDGRGTPTPAGARPSETPLAAAVDPA